MYLKVAAADDARSLTIYFDELAFQHMHLTPSETTSLINQIYKHFSYEIDSSFACIHIARVYKSETPPSLRVIYSDGTFIGENSRDIENVARLSITLSHTPVSDFSLGNHSKLLKKTESFITQLTNQLDKNLGVTATQRKSHGIKSLQQSSTGDVTTSTKSQGLLNEKVKAAIPALEAQLKELNTIFSELIGELEGMRPSREKVVAVKRALAQVQAQSDRIQQEIRAQTQETYHAATSFENDTKKLQVKIDELNKPLSEIKRELIDALYQIARDAAHKILKLDKNDEQRSKAIKLFNNKFVGIAEIAPSGETHQLSPVNHAYYMLAEQNISQLIGLFNLVAQERKSTSLATKAFDTLGSAADKVGDTTKNLGKAFSKTIATVRGQTVLTKLSKTKPEDEAGTTTLTFPDLLALQTLNRKAIFVVSEEKTGIKLDFTTEGSEYIKELLRKRNAHTDTKSQLFSAYDKHIAEKLEDVKQQVAALRAHLLTDRSNLETTVALHLQIEEIIGALEVDFNRCEVLKAELADMSTLPEKMKQLKSLTGDGVLVATITDRENKFKHTRKPSIDISTIHQQFKQYLSKLRLGDFAVRYSPDASASQALEEQLEHINQDKREIAAQLDSVTSYLEETRPVADTLNTIQPCLAAKHKLNEILGSYGKSREALYTSNKKLATLKLTMPDALIERYLPSNHPVTDAESKLLTAKADFDKATDQQDRFDELLSAVLENPSAQAEAVQALTKELSEFTENVAQNSQVMRSLANSLESACSTLESENKNIMTLCQYYVAAIQNKDFWHQQIKLLGGEKTESGVRVPTAIARMTRIIDQHPNYEKSGKDAYALLLALQSIAKDRIAERGHSAGLFNRRREVTAVFYDQLAKLSLETIQPSFADKVKMAEANLKPMLPIENAYQAPASKGTK